MRSATVRGRAPPASCANSGSTRRRTCSRARRNWLTSRLSRMNPARLPSASSTAETRMGRHAIIPGEVAELHPEHLGGDALAGRQRHRDDLGTRAQPARPPGGAGRPDLLDAEVVGVGEVRDHQRQLAAQAHHAVAVLEVERERAAAPASRGRRSRPSVPSAGPRTPPRTRSPAWASPGLAAASSAPSTATGIGELRRPRDLDVGRGPERDGRAGPRLKLTKEAVSGIGVAGAPVPICVDRGCRGRAGRRVPTVKPRSSPRAQGPGRTRPAPSTRPARSATSGTGPA